MGPRRFWRVGNREVIAKPNFPEDESSSIVLQRFFHGLEIGIWEITPGKRRPASGDGTARQLDVKRLTRTCGFRAVVPCADSGGITTNRKLRS